MRALPILLLLGASLGGCATTGSLAERDPRDPLEGFNRGVWGFNQAIDKAAVKPASQVYRAVTPVPARRGLSRVLSNLLEPLNAVNALLQGKPDRALNSLSRFVVNTTIGVGGLADHASEMGLPPTTEDFGQTLAVWGMKDSPYLVLPLLGPSTIRDGIGTGAQWLIDPASTLVHEAGASNTIEYSVTGVRLLNARSDVMDSGADAFLETSADPYAAARDAYFQSREAEIADRSEGELTPDEEQRELDKALQDGLQGGLQDSAPADAAPADAPPADAAPSAAPSESPAEPPPGAPSPAPQGTAAASPKAKLSMRLEADESIAY